MNTPQILDYWLTFFRGLFLGTLKNFLLFGFTGFGLGILSTIAFDSQFLDTADWSEWLETLILLLASCLVSKSRSLTWMDFLCAARDDSKNSRSD